METDKKDDEWMLLGPGICKKICKKGRRGRRPRFWSVIEIQFAFEETDISQYPRKQLRIGSAANREHRIVERLAQLMDESEISQFQLQESGTDIICTIHLVEVIEIPQSVNLWEKGMILDVVKAQKDSGVELYKNNNFVEAFYSFSSAVKLLTVMEVQLRKSMTIEQDQTTENLALVQVTNAIGTLYSNLGACHLQAKNYEFALKLSQEALDYNKNDIKALYRKALALTGLGNYVESRNILQLGLKLEPGNRQLSQLWKTVNDKCKLQDQPITLGMKKYFQ